MSVVRAGPIEGHVTATWTQPLENDHLGEQIAYIEAEVKRLLQQRLGIVSADVNVRPMRREHHV